MSVGVKNLGQVNDPRLSDALETLKEIRKCELAYKEAFRVGTVEQLWDCLEKYHEHKDFIIDWATRDAVGHALKSCIFRGAKFLKAACKDKEASHEVQFARVLAIQNSFELISLLARSAAHEVRNRI